MPEKPRAGEKERGRDAESSPEIAAAPSAMEPDKGRDAAPVKTEPKRMELDLGM